MPATAQQRATPVSSPTYQSQRLTGLSSPPSDTQPLSQFLPPPPISYEVEDEEKEGVWGYLIPLIGCSEPLVLKQRAACPVSAGETGTKTGRDRVKKKHWVELEEKYEADKAVKGVPAGGYLLGRHPECDRIIDAPTVSNRHCLIFSEKRDGAALAILEDLSGNGTYVNDGYVGRNKRRELHDGDEIDILGEARFLFRYPRVRDNGAFRQQFTIQGQLGKGHFATVYLATEKSSGVHYAVKKFEKRSGPGERSKVEGLQQEIAVLMGVSHPNVLCLKDTFDERDGVYLVLELAPEGELFNYIVMKQKLSEEETRKVFVQLFQGVKYLVSTLQKHSPSSGILPPQILTHRSISMSAILFTAISNPKISSSCPPTSASNLPTSVWLKLSARNLLRPPSAARLPMSPPKSSSLPPGDATLVPSTCGAWVLCSIFVSVGFRLSLMNCTPRTIPTRSASRSVWGALIIHRLIGIPSGIPRWI